MQKAINETNQLTGSVIDYTVDSMKRIINTAKNTLKDFLSIKPRLF